MQLPAELAHLAQYLTPRAEDAMTAPWLLSHFDARIWLYNFGYTRPQELDWEVEFYDGTSLTDDAHSELLKALRMWIIVKTQNHSHSINSNSLASQAADFYNVVKVIDYLLINAEELQLLKHGLAGITADDMADVIETIASSNTAADSIYQWPLRLTQYCKNLLTMHSEREIKEVLSAHPYIATVTPYQLEDSKLDLDEQIIAQIRAALFLERMYQKIPTGGYNVKTAKISSLLYKDTLAGKHRQKPLHAILSFISSPESFIREMNHVPVRAVANEKMTQGTAYLYRGCFTILSKLAKFDVQIPSDEDLYELSNIKPPGLETGRFGNVPSDIIFTAIKNAIEFHIDYGSDLLNSYLNILSYAKLRNCTITSIPDRRIQQLLIPSIFALGVTKLGLSARSVGREHNNRLKLSKPQYFSELRNNSGLLELIAVYFGGVQILVGATTAKRGSELRTLDAKTCLDKTKSWLIAKLSKSGINNFGRKSTVARPIDPLAAEMVSTIMEFRLKVEELGFADSSLPLFSSPGLLGQTGLTPCDPHLYYRNIDLFLDYFQSGLDDTGRRYYIRQHQLRRFFPLIFLDCGYGGSVELSQYVLGHTNPEHIWNYITEIIPGLELRNTKSQATLESIKSRGSQEFSDILDLIEERFGTRQVSVMDSDLVTGYLDWLQETGELTIEPVFFDLDSKIKFEIMLTVRRKDA